MEMTARRWAQMKSLFDSALDRSRAGRDRYLAALTKPSLASELRRLLFQAGTDGTLLRESSAVEEPSVEPERALTAGAVLCGRWEITSFLGAGGMGEVYQAWDREAEVWVALKTLRADLASQPQLVSRLRKELQLARRVAHPNVCKVFDFNRGDDTTGRNFVFLTMELLPGRPLSERLAEGPCNLTEAREIARQLFAGLGAAHDAGVIHRDLKSGNIFLCSGPNGLQVKITDFGLARDNTAGAQDSLVGGIVGTPAYMAPEQMQGLSITPAADIYAAGVVLYQMVTGQLPFIGNTPLAIAFKRIGTAAPSPKRLVPDLPAAWEFVILACLERDPARRPADASVLEPMLDGFVGPNRSVSRRWIIAGGVAAASAANWTILTKRQRPHNPEAVRSFKRGEEFAKSRTARNLNQAVKEYQNAVYLESGFAEAWAGLADSYSALANFGVLDHRVGMRKARQAADQAVSINSQLARAQGVLGYVVSLDVHHWREAEPYFQHALRLKEIHSMVRLWYGAYLGKSGRIEEAIKQIRLGLNDEPSSLPLNQQLATEYFRAQRIQEHHVQTLELVRLQPFEASSYLALARSYDAMKDYPRALQNCDVADRYGKPEVSRAFRACIHAAQQQMQAAIDIALSLQTIWESGPFESLLLACVWSRIGQTARTRSVLEEGYRREDSSILGAVTHPYLKGLRNDPLLAQFRSRLGWPV